ncbi:hypothetical protein [Rhizobium sp. TRM95796]|uniref:hypothetical protein n=1 Tax=Rhizobium sp. TRM95796 TaxID=2979862 RepID=UPI0021E90A74|nr:hypothetical protein [Rhizobium sp. TRM95796]MCV3768704.1 hypothetical protein [Rhizobium sp. TRM95796]
MFAYPPILSIVIGLCWTDFVTMFSAQTGVSRGRLIRMTIASSLLLTSLASIFSEANSALSLALLLAIAAAALLASRSLSSTPALSVASIGFALYFSGATP